MSLPFLCRSLRKMAVGMILASLAFAVAAAVELKINVSSINLKLHEGKTISMVFTLLICSILVAWDLAQSVPDLDST